MKNYKLRRILLKKKKTKKEKKIRSEYIIEEKSTHSQNYNQ